MILLSHPLGNVAIINGRSRSVKHSLELGSFFNPFYGLEKNVQYNSNLFLFSTTKGEKNYSE